jgi:hypothetical protein
VPNSDPPPKNKVILALAPILAPILIEPLREVTLDLSPLSNPYDCRVEWFDSLRNSLGYVPPLLVTHLLHPLPPTTGLTRPPLPHPFLPPLPTHHFPPHFSPRVTGVLTEKRSWIHCATSPGDMRKSSLHF